MKRLLISLALVLAIGVVAFAGGTRAQEPNYPATIAALETKVAALQTSVAKRDAKLDDQRTRIAELKEPAATATPTAPPAPEHLASFSGLRSDLTDPVHLVAGSYRVAGTWNSSDNFEPFFVNAYAPDGDVDFVIIESADSPGLAETSAIFIAPYDGDYLFEVKCNSRWTLTIDPV